MLNRVFLFQVWIAMIKIIAIASGRPNGKVRNETFLTQKIISMPIMAFGKTLPRYNIYWGVFLLDGNNIKGVTLIINVIAAIMKTTNNVCPTFNAMIQSPFQSSF